jgi:hypothetical protein
MVHIVIIEFKGLNVKKIPISKEQTIPFVALVRGVPVLTSSVTDFRFRQKCANHSNTLRPRIVTGYFEHFEHCIMSADV